MRCTALSVLFVVAATPAAAADAPLVEPGTPVRLMVLREVSTHSAKAGDRFPLLVDQAITRDGAIVVPLQAKAWGEVFETHENGSAGMSGKLAARLLWIDLPGGRVALRGELRVAGSKALVQTGLMAVASGLLAPIALLARGNNARLKAGDIVEGVIAEPIAGTIAEVEGRPAPAR